MSTATQIRINALLLEREGLWVRVHELEQAAAAILGEPYPFTRPVLPSDQRGKRSKATGRTAGGAGRPALKLRKLEAGEAAYRVTYQKNGDTVAEVHDAADAIGTLFAAQGARLRVLRVETVDAAGAVGAELFGADA